MSNRSKLLNYMVSVGKLLPAQVEPVDPEDENAPQWEKPLEESPLRVAVRALTDSREHPFIQSDILDATTLLSLLQAGGFESLNGWQLGRQLRSWYYRYLGVFMVNGQKLRLWTVLPTQELHEILRTVRQRANGTTAPTDPRTLSPFEQRVLSLRLRMHGLRYLRPREIARILECQSSAVYAASQSIARKMGLPGLSNPRAVRQALMDDPAFQ